jgi:hypothetical protein
MAGISSVIDSEKKHSELVTLYIETFSFIDEAPINIALQTACQILPNIRVVEDDEVYCWIFSIVSEIIQHLYFDEERSALIIALAEGLSKQIILIQLFTTDFLTIRFVSLHL